MSNNTSHEIMPYRMDPSLMKRLLGGKFPENGFHWDSSVAYFKLEDDDIWEPYGHYDDILPTTGFKIKVKPVDFL